MAPSRRTRTGAQNTFKLLHPQPVIYDFTDLSSKYGLKITIPPYSSWFCPSHWHETAPACETLAPFQGRYRIDSFFLISSGGGNIYGEGQASLPFVMPLTPARVVRWQRDLRYGSEQDAVGFSLKASDEVYQFYRQVCSVNQDAETYFQLPSTPLWLRLTYAFWGWIPYLGCRVRAWLLQYLLHIQLRVIYAENDYLENEGTIRYTLPWDYIPFEKPPKKWSDKERRSRVTVSKFVLSFCHWVGTNLLGMRARYEEYEVDVTTKVRTDTKDELL